MSSNFKKLPRSWDAQKIFRKNNCFLASLTASASLFFYNAYSSDISVENENESPKTFLARATAHMEPQAQEPLNQTNDQTKGNSGAQTVKTKQWVFYTGKKIDPQAIQSGEFHLFSGSANKPLAEEVASFLGVDLSKAKISKFADGETSISINENVRESHCFIIQPISYPASDNLIELLLLISTLRRASAKEITAIIPYYAYSRQDSKMTARTPIAAADVAIMMEEMGVDRVVSIDLHAGQIQGFFSTNVPVENLEAGPVGSSFFCEMNLTSPVVVSPDAGGVPRAKAFRAGIAKKYPDADLAMIIEENREKDSSGRLKDKGLGGMLLVGDVKDRDVIICEDIIDSGYTISHAAQELKERFGAKRIFGFATHGLFMGGRDSQGSGQVNVALDRISNSSMESLLVTNTVPLTEETKKISKLKQITLAPLIAEAIRRIFEQDQLSTIFDQDKNNSHAIHPINIEAKSNSS